MIRKASASGVSGPKFMVPRHSRLTFSPVLPSLVVSMGRDHARPRGRGK